MFKLGKSTILAGALSLALVGVCANVSFAESEAGSASSSMAGTASTSENGHVGGSEAGTQNQSQAATGSTSEVGRQTSSQGGNETNRPIINQPNPAGNAPAVRTTNAPQPSTQAGRPTGANVRTSTSSATGAAPQEKTTTYHWGNKRRSHVASKSPNRSYMVQTIHQAAKTR